MSSTAVLATAVVAAMCLGIGVYEALIGTAPETVALMFGFALFNTLMCIWNIALMHGKLVM